MLKNNRIKSKRNIHAIKKQTVIHSQMAGLDRLLIKIDLVNWDMVKENTNSTLLTLFQLQNAIENGSRPYFYGDLYFDYFLG